MQNVVNTRAKVCMEWMSLHWCVCFSVCHSFVIESKDLLVECYKGDMMEPVFCRAQIQFFSVCHGIGEEWCKRDNLFCRDGGAEILITINSSKIERFFLHCFSSSVLVLRDFYYLLYDSTAWIKAASLLGNGKLKYMLYQSTIYTSSLAACTGMRKQISKIMGLKFLASLNFNSESKSDKINHCFDRQSMHSHTIYFVPCECHYLQNISPRLSWIWRMDPDTLQRFLSWRRYVASLYKTMFKRSDFHLHRL